jgi:hypothetical protein
MNGYADIVVGTLADAINFVVDSKNQMCRFTNNTNIPIGECHNIFYTLISLVVVIKIRTVALEFKRRAFSWGE